MVDCLAEQNSYWCYGAATARVHPTGIRCKRAASALAGVITASLLIGCSSPSVSTDASLADGPQATQDIAITAYHNGVLVSGGRVWRHTSEGELRGVVRTDSAGNATVAFNPGDLLTVERCSDCSSTSTLHGFTTIVAPLTLDPELTDITIGEPPIGRTTTDETTIRVEALPTDTRAFVTTACDATTLTSTNNSKLFQWHEECDHADRSAIAAAYTLGSADRPTHFAVGQHDAADTLTLDSWQPLEAVELELPQAQVFELGVQIRLDGRPIRRFINPDDEIVVVAPRIGTWEAQFSGRIATPQGDNWVVTRQSMTPADSIDYATTIAEKAISLDTATPGTLQFAGDTFDLMATYLIFDPKCDGSNPLRWIVVAPGSSQTVSLPQDLVELLHEDEALTPRFSSVLGVTSTAPKLDGFTQMAAGPTRPIDHAFGASGLSPMQGNWYSREADCTP